MPRPDETVQRLIDRLKGGKEPSARRFYATVGEIVSLRQTGAFDDRTWLENCLYTAAHFNGTQAWCTTISLSRISFFCLSINMSDAVAVYAPYTASRDPHIAQVAMQLLEQSSALIPTGNELVGEGRVFQEIGHFLRRNSSGRTADRLIQRLYETDPEAALNTVANAYLEEAERKSVIRAKMQLEAAMLSYSAATIVQKPEAFDAAVQKLDELSHNSCWCARAYAASKSGALESDRGSQITQRLAHDENAVVAAIAEQIGQTKGESNL